MGQLRPSTDIKVHVRSVIGAVDTMLEYFLNVFFSRMFSFVFVFFVR